jgi:hypothetical protein
MECWWNDSERRELKYSEKKKLCHCHSIYCNYYMDWLGVEPAPPS